MQAHIEDGATAMAVKTAIYTDVRARNKPSFYATPVARATADFAECLIQDEEIAPHHTGMIVASDECSLGTIRELSRTAAQGTISPLRFAGASPSIVVGLPALQLGLRGPTLALTMPPDHAASAILAMIEYWIGCCNVSAVIVVAHHRQGERHLFKGLIARSSSGGELRQQVLQLGDPQRAPMEAGSNDRFIP